MRAISTDRPGRLRLRLAILTLALLTSALATAPTQARPANAAIVSPPVAARQSPPARDLPAQAGAPGRTSAAQPTGRISSAPSVGAAPARPDPLLGAARHAASAPSPDPLSSFEGISRTNGGGVPPDPIGDVGPNHYVQMVNAAFAIYDKSGNLLAGPININQLWSGAGGACATRNDGDPVVVYDELADRWLLSQFTAAGPPWAECIAISKTGDPTGAYWLYEFSISDFFPDYPKIGVWPDAYYMATNDNASQRLVGVYAFDRARMLNGQTATYQKIPNLQPVNYYLPADVDGPNPPPAGTPAYFYTFMNSGDRWGGPDRLEIDEMHVDWATPANTSFKLRANIPIASFNYTICGYFVFSCIPQLGGQKVDALSEYPMWRLAYRNFGDYEALVGNFTVNMLGTRPGQAGIRWFELRKHGAGTWQLQQEGTHAPDTNHRWMGSAAMDRDGDIAVGYSVSSSAMYPAIRYALHVAGDPDGTLRPEATLIAGGGAQTAGANRWGDYSAMSVDPVDGCTFWFTAEYYPTTSSSGWHTRIGTFRLPTCGALTVAASLSDANPPPEKPIRYTLTIANETAAPISGVTISDTLPAELAPAGVSSITPPSAGTPGSSPLVASNLTIPAGQSVAIGVPVVVKRGTPAGTPIRIPVTVAGSDQPARARELALVAADGPPAPANDTATARVGATASIDVLANDYDPNGAPLAIASVGTPSHGTAIIANGKITYTPAPGFYGQDRFSYTLAKGSLSASATVFVRVGGVVLVPAIRR